MKKTLSLLNLGTVILVILVNYISQALRLNNTTIGELSNKYTNLFTPASYAFAIWGLIFLSLFVYSIFQIKRAFSSKKPNKFILQTGFWFIIANVLNCAWVIAFVYDFVGLSLVIMFGILLSLIKIIINTNIGIKRENLSMRVFAWWPICLYAGWISVATIANASTFLTKLGWEGGLLSQQQWTIIMIIVAALLNVFLLLKRDISVFALVGVWALIAIYIRHDTINTILAITALSAAIILFIVIIGCLFIKRKLYLKV